MLSATHCVHANLARQYGVYAPLVDCAASVDVGCVPLVVQRQSSSDRTAATGIHSLLPTRLLGTLTRGVLRLYTFLEAIRDSVPAVTP